MSVSQRVAPFAALLRLNTKLLLNCLDGVSSDVAVARPAPPANSMAFLVAHLVDTRHELLALLGARRENPVADSLANASGIDDVSELPALPVLLDAWRGTGAALDACLAATSDAALDAPTQQGFPGSDGTTLGALAFLVQHDSYHIGQLAMLRRIHGLPAMSYRMR
ncbi:MAG TPA: DinB family protein [Gemmatimonadaceae bacterium]|jgi:uncharacterized damage-inducible protein DinB